MPKRSVLSVVLLAGLLAPAPRAAASERPAALSVTVAGIPAGVTVMAYWLERPLFEREAPPSHAGPSPFAFVVDAPPGAGPLKVWLFHKARGGGGAATFRTVTLKPGVRYRLAISPSDGYRLQFEVTEE